MTDTQSMHESLRKVRNAEPFLWTNPHMMPIANAMKNLSVTRADVNEAHENWQRLAPLLEMLFPELAGSAGKIESDLVTVPDLNEGLGLPQGAGRIFVKADHALPVAGSIKARGGLYEVCMHAWQIASDAELLGPDNDPVLLASSKVRAFLSRHAIAVGSTGNLGLSVGIAARALGFRVTVHMSSDAKAWKVKRLEDLGVRVVQHQADYGTAVTSARNSAQNDPLTYFVDDERSKMLFFGYSAAAINLKIQLEAAGVPVDRNNPLFLYLPCGIGGAPGGIAFGAKQVFGDNVHCFFVEPVQAPSALVQLLHGLETPMTVYDVGLTNKTEADGMAVAEVSQFVARVMQNLLSGVLTVADDDLYRWLVLAHDVANMQLEPSAASCFTGPVQIVQSDAGQRYIRAITGGETDITATHVMWTTGGKFVPQEQYLQFVDRGRTLASVR